MISVRGSIIRIITREGCPWTAQQLGDALKRHAKQWHFYPDRPGDHAPDWMHEAGSKGRNIAEYAVEDAWWFADVLHHRLRNEGPIRLMRS